MEIFIVIAITIILITIIAMVSLTTNIFDAGKTILSFIYSYFQGIKFSVHKGFSRKSIETLEDNGIEKYFFYKQYEDLKNTWKSTLSINEGNILLLKNRMKQRKIYTTTKIKTIRALGLIIGCLFSGVFFSIHFIIITIISIPVYMCYFLVMGIDKIKLKLGKISCVCPNCSTKFELPYYICKKCGRVHKHLKPSALGFLHRKCVCGETLSCTYFGDRKELKAICPKCSLEFKGGEASPICISVVEKKITPKNTLINSIIECLDTHIKKEKNWDIDILKDDKKVKNVFINSSKFLNEKLLYLYDIDREDFNKKQNIKECKYYKYVDGVIFIIEPFTNNSCDTNDLIDRFTSAIREIRKIKLNKLIDIKIAFVFKDIDAFSKKEKKLLLRKLDYNFSNYKCFYVGSLIEPKNVWEITKWILEETNNELK